MLLTACGGTTPESTDATTSSTITPPPPPPTPDTTAPSVNITGQSTSADKLTATGTASDNVGVTAVTWTNNRGGSGNASSTNQWKNWTANGITLLDGSNTITVTARDAAGNTKNASVTVNYTTPPPPPPPTPDTTAPSVNITGQSTSADKLTATGTASDNVGVTAVTWTNNRGGSGNASSTNQWKNWTANGITLQDGSNVITVTARDAAGNTKNASVTVDYAPLATNQALLLNWDPNPATDAVLGYIVYYGPTGSTATQQISDLSVSSGVIDPNAPAVTYNAGFDLGLKVGDPICFRLQAYNSAGVSTFSTAACSTI